MAVINIGANLASALKHLRLPLETRTLWVDFLCINQKDISERNSAVQRMDKVYKFAKSVHVFLGEAADDSDFILQTIEHFGRQIEITQQNSIGEAPEAEELHWWNPQVPLPYNEKVWNALTAILLRPWFTRLWVVQEAYLGGTRTKVQCGHSIVPWSAFIKIVMILGSKSALSQGNPKLSEIISSIKPSVTELGDAEDFPRLLNAICHRQCTDLRDKIYGILGILSSTISNHITADYRSSVADVYKYALLTDMNTRRRIQMLQSCDIETRIPGEPSWIPNWAGLAGRQQLSTYFGGIGRILLDTDGSTPASHIHPNILEIVGRQCAHVLNVSAPTSATVDGQVAALREILPTCCDDDEYITGGSLLDAFITVVSMGRVKEKFPHSVLYPSMAELRQSYQGVKSSSHQKPDPKGHLDGHLDGLKLISTKEGYIGVTLSKTQAGK